MVYSSYLSESRAHTFTIFLALAHIFGPMPEGLEPVDRLSCPMACDGLVREDAGGRAAGRIHVRDAKAADDTVTPSLDMLDFSHLRRANARVMCFRQKMDDTLIPAEFTCVNK